MIQRKKDWFSEKIIEYEKSLYFLSFSILKNNDDVADAVQSAICSAFENLDSLKDEGKFKPWIMRITANSCYEILRRKRDVLSLYEGAEDENSEASPDIDLRLSLWNSVQKLKDPYRTSIVLFYFEDLSAKDISGITGASENNVKKQLQRGREMLKKILETEDNNCHEKLG